MGRKTPENRKYHRIKRTLVVHFSVVKSKINTAALEDEHVGSTVNISAGGMLLRTAISLPADTRVEVHFKVSDQHGEVSLMGKVLRHVPSIFSGLCYLPIEFTSITLEQRQRIESFIVKYRKDPMSEL